MKKVTINGKQYDAYLNIRAAKTYKELTGSDISKIEEVTEMGAFIFACIDAAARFNKVQCPVTIDDIDNEVSLNELREIVTSLLPKAETLGE